MARNYRERYATDSEFRERKKAISRKDWIAHREERLAKRRADYAANRAVIHAHEALRRAKPENRERARQRSAEWRLRNPEGQPSIALKRKYGLTLQLLEEMLVDQNGCCAICGANIKGKKRPCVDHCHQTNQVRELLCPTCNFILGHADDRPELLRAAADYLERHHEQLRKSA